MITTHQISLWHQLADESEVELKATVSHIGHPNILEVVWDDANQAAIDGMGREQARDYEIRAEIAWADTMAKLDQPTDAEVRHTSREEIADERDAGDWANHLE